MDHERRSDAIVSRIEQKLDDHIEMVDRKYIELSEWQKNHIEWCKAEVLRLDTQLSPVRKAFDAVERPIKWVGWTVTIGITGALLWCGQKTAAWLGHHWSP